MVNCNELKNHIINVCLNSEYGDKGRLTKFNTDKIYWYFSDTSLHTNNDIKFICEVFDEISKHTHITFINKKPQFHPYILIYIGDQNTFEKKYINEKIHNKVNGYVTWYAHFDRIYKSIVFVNNKLKDEKRKSVIREEITQALGMTGDTEYDDTVFFKYKNNNKNYNKYFDCDKKLFEFLYGGNSKFGMNKQDIENMHCDYIMNEKTINNHFYYFIIITFFIFILFQLKTLLNSK